MQLKEFSLISPVLESADVFQAIETVIPPDVIEQTLGHTNSIEERVTQAAITVSKLLSIQFASPSITKLLATKPAA